MIRIFERGARILFFPRRWANSVSRWILGIHSPTGTVRIANTANPGEEGSCTFDVNEEEIFRRLRGLMDMTFVTVRGFFAKLERHIDRASIVSDEGRVKVGEDWLKRKIEEATAELPDTTTPAEPGSGVDGVSSTFDLASDAWTRGSAGLQIKVFTRAWIYNQTDGKLVVRTLTFDKYGQLKAVSAEQGAADFVIQS